MTYAEIKQLDKAIQRQVALMAVLESQNDIGSLSAAREKQNELCCKRATEINRLPINTLEGSCLYLRLCKNLSWQQIAMRIGGNNTKDSVRKMCSRFKW